MDTATQLNCLPPYVPRGMKGTVSDNTQKFTSLLLAESKLTGLQFLIYTAMQINVTCFLFP